MKAIGLVLLILVALPVYGQGFNWTPRPVITDSVVWHVTDTLNIGDTTCSHDWVNGPRERAGGKMSCGVYHAGRHCDWDDGVMERICRRCLRKEVLREQWYQRAAPESEFEKLDKSVKGKVKRCQAK